LTEKTKRIQCVYPQAQKLRPLWTNEVHRNNEDKNLISYMAKDSVEQAFPEDTGSQEHTDTVSENPSNKAVNVATKNWKSEFALSKKIPPMPAKNWKKDFDKFAITPMTKSKPEKEKKVTKPLKRTPIAPIGKKKKARILEEGSEVDLFRKIWNTRPRVCEECGKPVKGAFLGKALIKPQCFSHKLPKGMYSKFRLLEENIDLVCSMECHTENAKKYEDLETRYNMEKEFTSLL
jgi:hypothetical protein